MSTNKLRVTISGPTKSGKTTVARVIAEALKKAGFDDTVVLDSDASNKNAGIMPYDSHNLRRFADGLRVDVLTVNTFARPLNKNGAPAARVESVNKVKSPPTT